MTLLKHQAKSRESNVYHYFGIRCFQNVFNVANDIITLFLTLVYFVFKENLL